MSLLRTAGVEAAAAASGTSALTALAEHNYHAVLVDFYLGDMTGDELARRVRELYGRRHRIVGLSGDSEDDTRKRALEAGMDAFLCKPATIEAIHAVLTSDGPTCAGYS